VGDGAGGSLTDGGANVFVGTLAGRIAQASGDMDNVYVGKWSGYSASTAKFNTYVGSKSGWLGNGSYNTVLGFQALRNPSGSFDVAIGYEAGYNSSSGTGKVMVGAESGRSNSSNGHISIGYQAGYSQTSGANNTNLGYQAAYSNTTGLDRVAIGHEAGKSQTGSYNVFVGARCGKGSGSGSANVAIGQGVMEASAEASSCVFIGNYMASNVTSGAARTIAIGVNCLSAGGYSGEENTVVGHQAGNSLSSGDSNTLMGFHAGYNLSTGSENTLYGFEAGKNIQSSTDNTCVGRNSGSGIISSFSSTRNSYFGSNAGSSQNGTKNTGIGWQALSSGSGEGNVSVGYQSGFGMYSSANYNTAIGYQTQGIGNGSNNTLLGNNAAASSTTVSNEITLGNSSITSLRCAVTSITSLSDERDKSEIEDLSYGLAFIDALQPREFVWDNRPEISIDEDENGNIIETEFYSANKGKKDFGFIAQEVRELDNDTLRLVYAENEDKLELSYGKLVPILVKAIQELKEEVEEMYKNLITSENTPDSHKAVIVSQVDGQLAEAADSETTAEKLQILKDHFLWLLSNDFYKDECSAEQVAGMESYLPADYADQYCRPI